MNYTLAKCGHSVVAAGSPGSDARKQCEGTLCPDCFRCFRDGQDANDHNRRVYRNGRGTMKGNPFEVGSSAWKAWKDGYAYRDMVNDG